MSDNFSFDYFTRLEGLIQLFSCKSSRFVLLSSVSPDAWTVKLGQISDGKWWEGVWSEEDVLGIAGQNVSAKHMKAFSQRLEATIAKGEVDISNWDPSNWDPSSSKAEGMSFVLDPTAKRPLHLPLRELSTNEAARFTVKYLSTLAEHSREHQNRLFSRSSITRSSSSKRQRSPSPSQQRTSPKTRRQRALSEDDAPSSSSSPAKRHKSQVKSNDKGERGHAQGEIERLKQELVRVRNREERAEREHRERERELIASERLAGGSTDKLKSRAVAPAAARRPGSSLANPNQKARRYQATQFVSDSD